MNQRTPAEETVRRFYSKCLGNMGFPAEIDPDGDVAFIYEDEHYFIDIDLEDPEYLRVILPDILDARDDSQIQALNHTFNLINSETETSKIFFADDNRPWISSEMFLTSLQNFPQIIQHMVLDIQEARTKLIHALDNPENPYLPAQNTKPRLEDPQLQTETSGIVENAFAYLRTEGFRPTRIGEDITFISQGKPCHLQISQSSKLIARIVSINPFQEQSSKLPDTIAAALRATALTKVAKMFVLENDIWRTATCLLPNREDFVYSAKRLINVLGVVEQKFTKILSFPPIT